MLYACSLVGATVARAGHHVVSLVQGAYVVLVVIGSSM